MINLNVKLLDLTNEDAKILTRLQEKTLQMFSSKATFLAFFNILDCFVDFLCWRTVVFQTKRYYSLPGIKIIWLERQRYFTYSEYLHMIYTYHPYKHRNKRERKQKRSKNNNRADWILFKMRLDLQILHIILFYLVCNLQWKHLSIFRTVYFVQISRPNLYILSNELGKII